MEFNLSLDLNENAEWKVISQFQLIRIHKVKGILTGELKEINKSLFHYTVNLQRNPTSSMLYLIIPTVIISIFNNFAYFIPGNKGSG